MDLYLQAKTLGIQADFVNAHGEPRRTEAAPLQAIVDAMPPRTRRRILTGAIVARPDRPATLDLSSAPGPVKWRVVNGDALVAQGDAENSLTIPSGLTAGIYRFHIQGDQLDEEAPLVVASGPAFSGGFERAWILAIQLYGVRSRRNWGIGDFSDLKVMVALAADLGAAGVGVNPLHTLFDDRPGDCSPYSPNSRLFLNPLYIDVTRLDGVSEPDQQTLTGLRGGKTVDYHGVAALKWPALREAFAAFRKSPDTDFETYRNERGALLLRFSCFEVMRHQFKMPWWDWPAEWRQPDDAKCAALSTGAQADDVAFVMFTQWIADQQLRDCRDAAKQNGMSVGLYLDVAVGAQGDGFDAWNEQTAIARELAVGAPPDILNTVGQNWGLAGFNAAGLELANFVPFRDMLRASMRYAGAIRLDHVLGLQRLYLIPQGFAAKDGAYVTMPLEAMLAIAASESAANACVVIGEDLGTVPEGFGDRLSDWGVWSYRVMMFERDNVGHFFGGDHYPANALVTFSTHDLATFSGWRSMYDLGVKRALNIDPGESDDARRHALEMLRDVLRNNAIEHDDFYAVLRFLTRTNSRLLAISLEDLLDVEDQPNIPGTVDEHPNWRQRLVTDIDSIASVVDRAILREATQGRSASATMA